MRQSARFVAQPPQYFGHQLYPSLDSEVSVNVAGVLVEGIEGDAERCRRLLLRIPSQEPVKDLAEAGSAYRPARATGADRAFVQSIPVLRHDPSSMPSWRSLTLLVYDTGTIVTEKIRIISAAFRVR